MNQERSSNYLCDRISNDKSIYHSLKKRSLAKTAILANLKQFLAQFWRS
jgi:hypothetical protein